jgi:hypothetical protein|tara:strand:- start:375 stop:626 length:252 start_codon:yes stop_codon:yes gene_type:complete
MSKNKNCPYTKVLNRLNILDEQIFQMQTSISKVREIITLKSQTEDNLLHNDEPTETSIESYDKRREAQIETVMELEKKKNKDS